MPCGSEFQYWNNAVCEAVFELDISIDPTNHLDASIHRQNLGPIALSRIKLNASQTIRRTHAAITRSRNAQFELVLFKRGGASLLHCGREMVFKTGDLVLIDNRETYTLVTDISSESLSFHIPVDWLKVWIPEPENVVGLSIGEQSPWGPALIAAMEAIPSSLGDGEDAFSNLYADQIAGALTLAVGPAARQQSPHTQKLLQRIRKTILEMAHDHELDAAKVAKAMNISVRYMHALFSAANTTYSHQLISVRLERASRLLGDRRFLDLPVSEIAWRSGFADQCHFSRKFRERFGQSPGVFRSRQLA